MTKVQLITFLILLIRRVTKGHRALTLSNFWAASTTAASPFFLHRALPLENINFTWHIGEGIVCNSIRRGYNNICGAVSRVDLDSNGRRCFPFGGVMEPRDVIGSNDGGGGGDDVRCGGSGGGWIDNSRNLKGFDRSVICLKRIKIKKWLEVPWIFIDYGRLRAFRYGKTFQYYWTSQGRCTSLSH